ncbi:hypothetical protein Avbf_08795 [Armadillidium vulgare]|nr:hypothetical protein Avbf_08795 [Armadillidium vulgare]
MRIILLGIKTFVNLKSLTVKSHSECFRGKYLFVLYSVKTGITRSVICSSSINNISYQRMKRTFDVIVIGCGASGLAAAKELENKAIESYLY